MTRGFRYGTVGGRLLARWRGLRYQWRYRHDPLRNKSLRYLWL